MFADRWLPRSKETRAAWIAALAGCLLLLALPWLIHLDGKPHADWQQFLGRFHPLLVHIPIGLIVLVPLLEIAGRLKPALRESAGFVLALAFASCLGALVLGFLLAYGGGTAGTVLSRHMWGGIALTMGVLMCLLARPWWASATEAWAYPALLTSVMLALVWTAHQGGSLTHGSDYLTRYMPSSLKRFLPEAQAKGTAASFYAKHIHPILDANCVGCHGDSKASGGLRVDSYDLLMKGGKDGQVIVPGQPEKSMLLMRVTLPTDHKQFMPAEGRAPLRSEEIAWIKAWVSQGASQSIRTLQGIPEPAASKEPPPQPVGDYSALAAEIVQMERGQGAKLLPVSSKPEDGLVLYTVDIAPNFGDAQLAQFQRFAPYIVEAELGRTAVTDASFDTLAKFTHLRALHLEETKVTGSGLSKLTALTQLTYLNLNGTKVTQASVAVLDSMKNLRHVYLYNTPAQPASAAEQKQANGRSTP